VVTALFVDHPDFVLVDSLGNPVEVGSVIADRQLSFTPLPNAFGLDYLVLTYRVNDGTEDSADTATTSILVNPVNDLPVPTLSR
jgi:hypothetical protein